MRLWVRTLKRRLKASKAAANFSSRRVLTHLSGDVGLNLPVLSFTPRRGETRLQGERKTMQILREVFLAGATMAMLWACWLRLPATTTMERARKPRVERRARITKRN